MIATKNSEESFVSRAISSWYNGSQQLLMAAKERLLGENWWVPSDMNEVVLVPHYSLKKLIKMKEHELFILSLSDFATGVNAYHVLMKWKNADRLSVIRAKTMDVIVRDFNTLIVFAELFHLIDNVKDVKTLISMIMMHPLWRPVHVAAKMGFKSFFEIAEKQGNLKKLLGLTSQPEQQYAFHIAIENIHVDLVKYLIGTGAFCLSTSDVKGQNALHYCANSSFQMVQVLCEVEESKDCMNRLNVDGYTPLFLSIINCRPSCTTALLKQGAILNVMCHGRSALHEAMLQNNSKVKDVIKTLVEASPEVATQIEPDTGNTALHLAANKTSLASYLEVSTSADQLLNTINKSGRTALHCHTYRNDLGCVITLATHNADLDFQDAEGNTSLHIAVFNGYLDIVKALLALGADVNLRNHDSFTCRHLAAKSKDKTGREIFHCLLIAGAETCSSETFGCGPNCGFSDDSSVEYDSSESQPPSLDTSHAEMVVRTQLSSFDLFLQQRAVEAVKRKKQSGKKMQILLSLDGGGIRGLILVMILKAIEKELKKPIIDYIDWVAGTSTGSFLAASLSTGRTLTRCQHNYLRLKDHLFEGWARPYSGERLEKSLIAEYGESTTMADVTKTKLLVTTTIADKQPVKFHAFRSYTIPAPSGDLALMSCDDPKDIPIWKALRCSSAAPFYFPAVEKKFLDGGFMANNPTTELMSEIHRLNAIALFKGADETDLLEMGCVLSIGTGRMPDIPVDSLNLSTSSPVESMTAIRTLSTMLVDQVTATEGLPVERARSWCHDIGVPYYRLSTPLSKEFVLDMKDDKEVVQMMWETVEYMHLVRPATLALVELLKFLKD